MRHPSQGNVVGYKTCPICGKLFYVPSADWAYRRVVRFKHKYIKIEYYCKWSCLRKREAEIENKHKKIIDKATERRTKKRNATLRQKRLDRIKSDRTQ